jgi:hypothetical protein
VYSAVAASVVRMTPVCSSYDEIDSPAHLREDAAAARLALHRRQGSRVARAVAAGPPSLAYDDYPREVPKREIEVGEAAARIANALHLHLD